MTTMSLFSNHDFCHLAHLADAKGEGDDHKDHVDVLQRVLELANFSIWRSFRVKSHNNHTDHNGTTGEHEAQYRVEISIHKIRIGRSQIGVAWAKDAPGEPIF